MRLKLGLITCLCLCVLLQGCTPLRKKFTRKKKQDKQAEFIPVLDPIDYPAPVISARERYAYHFSLWRIWNRDLLKTFDRQVNQKNQRYLLAQLIVQLEEMKKWVVAGKQDEIDLRIGEVQKIQKIFKKPAPMRNTFSLKKKIELNAKKIHNQLKPKLMADFYTVGSYTNSIK